MMKSKNVLFGLIIFSGIALLLFFITELSLRSTPRIESLSQYSCMPGEKILILGEGFGDGQRNSQLFFSNREIKATHIEVWEDSQIRFRVPSFEESASLWIKTSGGRSESMVVYHREQFPQTLGASFLPGYPYVEYVDPSSGFPGTKVSLQGYNFGDNRGSSEIWVNRRANNPLSYFEQPVSEDFIQPGDDDYVLWDNDRIQFYLPDEVISGFIYIKTAKGFSNPIYFDIEEEKGNWTFFHNKGYMLTQEVVIDRIGAQQNNGLYLWIPRPLELDNQFEISILSSSHDAYMSTEKVDLIRLQELETGDHIVIERKIWMQVQTKKAELNQWLVSSRYNQERVIYQENTGYTDDFPTNQSTLRSISSSVTRGSQNAYLKSQFVYNYIIEKLDPSQRTGGVLDLLRAGDSSSRGYSNSMVTLLRIAGVPARRVSGVYITDNGESIHHWVEIYFEHFGWFPADPYLADNSDAAIMEEDFYWGGQGAGRIAFSKGEHHYFPLGNEFEISEFNDLYCSQNLFEGKTGNLLSYRSQWAIPRLLFSTP